MDLRRIKTRVDELLAASEVESEPPSTIVVLPENGRGPDSDAPYPRIERVGQAAIITYLVEDGAPDAAAIAALLGERAQ